MAIDIPQRVARKANCFSSSWWAVDREEHLFAADGELLRRGRPIRFVLLQKSELFQLAQIGRVAVPGHGVVEA